MAFFLCLEILNTDNEHSSSASDSSSEGFNEEDAITYYFNRGYRYDEIIQVLFKNHQHKISYRTLIRRLQQYGLQRRANKMSDRQFELAMRRIDDIISGPGSLGGYRTVWHTLELEGIRVPRLFVQLYVKERDPDRSSQVYLSLVGFSVFAFTLDICFYFENTRAKVHWRLQRFSHVSTEFKIIQLKI